MRIALAALAAAALALAAAAPAQAGVVKKKRLHVKVGRAVLVVGHHAPARAATRLQVHRRGAWRTIARDRTSEGGRFVLRERARRPMSTSARILVGGAATPVGRVNAYRYASASWYGPGLYGNKLGCGGTLTPGRLGVAHKSLPCGTRLTLKRGARTVSVRVIDRGPYVGGREYDLTAATAQKLHFHGTGAVLTTR